MLLAGLALVSALSNNPWAQEPAPPKLTAAQVIEKSLEASPARQAGKKLTSTTAKGELVIKAMGVKATLELLAKAPDRRLLVVTVEGYGEVRRGCDGKGAWVQDPNRGMVDLEGAELADALRECAFDALGRWRELYSKVELARKEKVGERDTYQVVMTPASGQPVIRYFDAESFLLVRQIITRATPEGPAEVRTDLSDYRGVGGFLAPFRIREAAPTYAVDITIAEATANAEIDDARFVKPWAK